MGLLNGLTGAGVVRVRSGLAAWGMVVAAAVTLVLFGPVPMVTADPAPAPPVPPPVVAPR